MSIQVTYPQPVNATRLKQFFWDVKDNRNTPRGIGGYYINDKPSIPYETSNTTATVVAQYTFTAGAGTNYIRVRVYGYVASGTGYYAVVINGTTVAGPVSTTSTTNVLLIDYLGSLTPNTSYTVQISAYVSGAGAGAYVTQVSINAGFGLTSTASTTILTINLDPNNDTYTLKVTGNFVYQLGIKWAVMGNKKTTTNVVLSSNLSGNAVYNNSVSGDDGDNNVLIVSGQGYYATSFTISGYVGASGDVLIITEIYAQIEFYNGSIFIKETGIVYIMFSWKTLIPGYNASLRIYEVSPTYDPVAIFGNSIQLYASDSQGVQVSNLTYPCNNGSDGRLAIGSSAQIGGSWAWGYLLFVNIIVVGV